MPKSHGYRIQGGVSPNISSSLLLTSYRSHVALPMSNCRECGGKYDYNMKMGVGSQHYKLQIGELKEREREPNNNLLSRAFINLLIAMYHH